jgi:tripartite-type tricarboxylate transporter receptor subunit TctC
VIARLNAEITKALASADVRAKLAVQGADPLGSTPAEYGQYIRSEIDRFANVIRQSGVTIE